jgi:hypothetical protein
MSVVFLDTVGLLALWDESDQWQAPACEAMSLLDVPGKNPRITLVQVAEAANDLASDAWNRY